MTWAATSSIGSSLSTTPDKIPFSGVVTANDAPFLPNAEVMVNGAVTHSSATGEFSLMLKADAPRFVVTIRKPGYQMLSRALHAAVTGANFELFRAQDLVVNPADPINVAEKPRENEKSGVSLTVAANSLGRGSNGAGGAPAGSLHVQLATYNLHDAADQLPGDYGGIDKATGAGVRLQTFGAADIEIVDAAGNPYNLAHRQDRDTAHADRPLACGRGPGEHSRVALRHSAWDVERGRRRHQGRRRL
jgi:hypothetical protein